MKRLGIEAILGTALIVITLIPLRAQTPSAFEVASIKQAAFSSDSAFAGYTAAGTCGQVRLAISGTRLTLSRVSLCGLISMAFDIRDYRISREAVNWITKPDRSLYYDIQGSAPEGLGTLTPQRAREMLQTLLADRFQLKVHREMRELAVYALVIGKNGPKLTLSPKGPCATARGSVLFSFGGASREIASCQSQTSMAQLALSLSRETDRPVVDQTGLEGGHVFELRWGVDGVREESEPEPLPSLFTAVQEQLGLKLEATKVLVEVLVIDSAEKPSEN